MSFYNFSPIEIIWTLVALVGLWYAAKSLRRASLDVRVLRRREVGNGRLISARARRYRGWLRLGIQTIFLADGLIAGFTMAGEPLRQVIAVTLVIAALLTILAVRSDVKEGDRLDEYLKASETSDRDAREDREFGTVRRQLEAEHKADES